MKFEYQRICGNVSEVTQTRLKACNFDLGAIVVRIADAPEDVSVRLESCREAIARLKTYNYR
ncbi:hypothetical protein [Nostoc sp.]|uniref:hypothetical protein n=1 Tax=Nostoc sp. TaxID=1180 RepID=UPI002FF734D9